MNIQALWALGGFLITRVPFILFITGYKWWYLFMDIPVLLMIGLLALMKPKQKENK